MAEHCSGDANYGQFDIALENFVGDQKLPTASAVMYRGVANNNVCFTRGGQYHGIFSDYNTEGSRLGSCGISKMAGCSRRKHFSTSKMHLRAHSILWCWASVCQMNIMAPCGFFDLRNGEVEGK